MIAVRISKGHNLNITGAPSSELEELKSPLRVAALPERIEFIKPRLLVKVGDLVKIGTALFEDKRNTDLKFLSPGGGEVVEINYGLRRVIREIVIRLDAEEQYEEFILPCDLLINDALGPVGIHTCSGPHVFNGTLEKIPVEHEQQRVQHLARDTTPHHKHRAQRRGNGLLPQRR